MTVRSWLFWLLLSCPVIAREPPRILLLNSYHPQYQWTYELVNGVRDELDGVLPAENLHIEYMDARRFVDDDDYVALLNQLLFYKYREISPDIVISSDDAAFYFLLEYSEQLFGEVPVVFGGVNVYSPSLLDGRAQFVGILEGMDIAGNLALIRRLQPDIERIILLGDTTGLGGKMVRRAREIQQSWQNDPELKQIRLDIWDHYSLEELWRLASQVDGRSALLMLAVHKDRDGHYFSFDKHLPRLSEISSAPIYGMWGGLMIGHGVLGGRMNDPYQHGRSMASIARRVWRGEPLGAIGVQSQSVFEPQFDYRQLQRFNIEDTRLPPGSKLWFKPQTFYQQYQSLVLSAIGVLTLLMAVISVLAFNVSRRRRAEGQLRRFNQALEETVARRTSELLEQNARLAELTAQLSRLAHTDTLTELRNRRAGTRRLKKLLRRFLHGGDQFSIALMDLDDFKWLNDTHGHETGDEVLVAVARSLESCIRPTDSVYRWGGEEFLLLLPATGEAQALGTCQRINRAVESLSIGEVVVTLSIGVTAVLPGDEQAGLLKRADTALYQAKERGRNQVVQG